MKITGNPPTARSAAAGIVIFTAAARRLSKHAGLLDDKKAAKAEDDEQFLKRAEGLIDAALSAVVMAFCSVEAATNELMLAHRLGNAQNMTGFAPDLAERLSQLWEPGAEKLTPLEKADASAILAGAKPFDRGKHPAQQVVLLGLLRNELVHHKPEYFETSRVGVDSSDKLERSLCTRFPLAAIWAGRNVPFRWNGCLGAGCAAWAFKTAHTFNQRLYETVGAQFPVKV